MLLQVPDHEMSGDGFEDDDGDDDDEGSDFDIDETDLESYSTVLEANEDIDEFQIFCESLQSKFIPNRFHFLSTISSSSPFRTSSGYNWLQSSIITKSYTRTTYTNSKYYSLHREKETRKR